MSGDVRWLTARVRHRQDNRYHAIGEVDGVQVVHLTARSRWLLERAKRRWEAKR